MHVLDYWHLGSGEACTCLLIVLITISCVNKGQNKECVFNWTIFYFRISLKKRRLKFVCKTELVPIKDSYKP